MRLTDILTPARIKAPLTADTKRGLIEELLDVMIASGAVTDRERVLQTVLERENTRTTGIGGGMAIPHGKCASITEPTVAIGRAAKPVDFESIDGKPVWLVILLISPVDQTASHIQALARISRIMSIDSFRNKLASADAATMYQLIKDQDAQNG